MCYGFGMNKINNDKSIVPEERIEQIIFIIRNQKVILDSDLATLYGVETKALNRAVKRNVERFPEDFMFQLTKDEAISLRYQFGTLDVKT
jgi:formaldehyde-activating enzyme involved in methanogenesis